jgi:hypothetical protein
MVSAPLMEMTLKFNTFRNFVKTELLPNLKYGTPLINKNPRRPNVSTGEGE